MNVEYIWLSSHYAMQIKVSSAIAHDFNQLLYALCAPPLIEDLENISHLPHRFLALPRPVSPREKKPSSSIPVFIELCRKYVIASVNYSFVSINSQ